ncbi:type II toxin-antitoxin system HicB family antitoxin [Desulfoferrobacter suflitae]|uniref:type II toxin-antitoxin system HicB family antitoxin n=1 Tax=Desulfoferrobacter suflitae TaxID=2865782 RepID=UPI0021645ECD|nr:type II toxin-antitoxin system HicB family antitoxin [Desulfoferrobacter suflitae]MCK8602605.1 type II toxin-antitoxin system HicB family antitoxin [Desulfoferrobacter suflitae]
MKGELTAIIEPAPEGGFWAICPEVHGANGQGESIEEAKASLRQAIELNVLSLQESPGRRRSVVAARKLPVCPYGHAL